MNTIKTTAPGAGAQGNCAQNVGQEFPPVSRWSLIAWVEDCARGLGLNGGDLVALQALLSFLPLKEASGKEILARPDMLLICYASNASITTRAKHMDESNLRVHIRKLVSVGLVRRKDSATGKRFPLKKNGEVVDAFGLDLRPAFEKALALRAMSDEIRAHAEERRALRAETFALRRKLVESSEQIDPQTEGFLAGITKILRRKTTTLDQIKALRDRILDALRNSPAEPKAENEPPALPAGNISHTEDRDGNLDQCPDVSVHDTPILPASGGQITREVESITLNTKKTHANTKAPCDLQCYEDLQRSFPNTAPFLQRDLLFQGGFQEELRSLGLSLGLRNLPYLEIVRSIGISSLLSIFEKMIVRVESIKHPQRYFEQALVSELTAVNKRLI